MIVITTGKKYIDIDGYASCLAYRELLCLRGIDAKAVSTASPNYSVTDSLLNFSYKFDDYEIQDNDEFVIVDLSNKAFFENFVKEDKITLIIDHHPGYEDYWQYLKDKAIIDSIGSVATIIVEMYEEYNLLDKMDKEIALLLMAAILDNTINFTANITNKRDIDAYKKLESIARISDFRKIYFEECQKFIECNLERAIINDLKIEKVNDYLPEVLGQLTIWDVSLISRYKEEIERLLNNYGDTWLINIISLKDNKSYIYCSNEKVSNNLLMLFDGVINDSVLILSPAKLRKELIKASLLKGY